MPLGVSLDTELVDGDEVDRIIESAKKNHADLLPVVGPAAGHPPDRATGQENCRTVSVRSAGRPDKRRGRSKVGKGVERKHKCLLKQDLARATRDFGGSDGLQLMAVAVALTTHCPYCIELHVKAAPSGRSR